MKRPRPYVPLPVRVIVAERQLHERNLLAYSGPNSTRLKLALATLFGDAKVHLDHNPPLRVRKFNKRTGKYKPDANDPKYLVYLTDEAHRFKTNVRGDGAQFPDRVLINRERKRERPKKNRKHKWATRPMQSRNTFRRAAR